MTSLALRPDAAPAGQRWTLDLDVARLANLADSHDIRRTIEDAIKSNDIRVPGGDRISESPMVRPLLTQVQAGGGFREVTEYHLDDAAVILILTRLRTPEAKKLVPGLLAKLADREGLVMAALPTMLAAAREEGRREALALSASTAVRLDVLERRVSELATHAGPVLLAAGRQPVVEQAVLILVLDGIQEAIAALRPGRAVSVHDLVEALRTGQLPKLREALARAPASPDDMASPAAFGYWLRRYAGRVAGGRYLASRKSSGVRVWRVLITV